MGEYEYTELDSKSVLDSDGFYTDYTLYQCEDSEGNITYVCIFGDNELYTPDNSDPDFETEDEDEAYEWFESYEGFDEDEDYIDSATETSGIFHYATDIVKDMYSSFPKFNYIKEETDPDDPLKLRLYFDASDYPKDIEYCCDYLDRKGIEYYLNHFTIVIIADDDEGIDDLDDNIITDVQYQDDTLSNVSFEDNIQNITNNKLELLSKEPSETNPDIIEIRYNFHDVVNMSMKHLFDFLKENDIKYELNSSDTITIYLPEENIEECEDMKKTVTSATEDKSLRNRLIDAVDTQLISFEEDIIPAIQKYVPEYDRDWCAEDTQFAYEDAREQFINSMVDDILLAYYEGE